MAWVNACFSHDDTDEGDLREEMHHANVARKKYVSLGGKMCTQVLKIASKLQGRED